jgi:hypothetical protein
LLKKTAACWFLCVAVTNTVLSATAVTASRRLVASCQRLPSTGVWCLAAPLTPCVSDTCSCRSWWSAAHLLYCMEEARRLRDAEWGRDPDAMPENGQYTYEPVSVTLWTSAPLCNHQCCAVACGADTHHLQGHTAHASTPCSQDLRCALQCTLDRCCAVC